MKTMKRWVMGLVVMAGLSAAAQTAITFTNTLYYTNRWTSAVARVQSQPSTTNDPWTVQFTFQGTTTPGWALTTNNATISYGASAYASVQVTNSEIATANGLTVSQVVNAAYFTAATNAINAALQKLIQSTIGR